MSTVTLRTVIGAFISVCFAVPVATQSVGQLDGKGVSIKQTAFKGRAAVQLIAAADADNGASYAVVKDSAGAIHAIGDTCTHGDISLSEGFVEDDTLECWAHGSKFSLTTGKPLTLPAYEPVPVYAVEIRDGDVYIDPDVKKDIA